MNLNDFTEYILCDLKKKGYFMCDCNIDINEMMQQMKKAMMDSTPHQEVLRVLQGELMLIYSLKAQIMLKGFREEIGAKKLAALSQIRPVTMFVSNEIETIEKEMETIQSISQLGSLLDELEQTIKQKVDLICQ